MYAWIGSIVPTGKKDCDNGVRYFDGHRDLTPWFLIVVTRCPVEKP